MAKVPIHFMGFVAKVDDSVTKLNWGEDFSICKWSPDEDDPFLKGIREFYGESGVSKLLYILSDWESVGYLVRKDHVDEYEFPRPATPFPDDRSREIRQPIEQRISSLRLFKEGNTIVQMALLYGGDFSKPTFLQCVRKQYIPDRTKFTLEDWEIPDAQSFIEEIRVPFQMAFLQTAFELFEHSYELDKPSTAFLSLMIAMEVLLGPQGTTEMTHQVSRNAAVLLGVSKSDSEKIYRDMKCLYKKRSKIVHGGTPSKATDQLKRQDLLTLRGYVRATIRELHSMGAPEKKPLQEILNPCGFGERPWRAKR